MPRLGFSPICQLSLASCYHSGLFPWKRMVPLSLNFVIKLTSSQDQTRFLLHRPRSRQEPLVCKSAGGLAARVGGSASLVSENLPYLSYRLLQRYLTICKYYVSLWCTLCSCLFLNQNACLGGDERLKPSGWLSEVRLGGGLSSAMLPIILALLIPPAMSRCSVNTWC